MKLHQFLFIILFAGFFSCNSTKNEVKIYGQITGQIPEKIIYTLPINGVCNFAFTEDVKPDSSGQYEISLEIQQPVFFRFYVTGKVAGGLILEPGRQYEVNFDLNDTSNSFNLICDNQKGQEAYNALPLPFYVSNEAQKLSSDSITSLIVEKINTLKENDVSKFQDLLSNKDISDEFYELLKMDRECYYAALLGNIALNKTNYNNFILTPEIRTIWEEAFTVASPVTNKYLRSYLYFELATNYGKYKKYTDSSSNSNKNGTNNGYINSYEDTKNYLTGEMLEYYTAAALYQAGDQNKFEKELITLYEEFNVQFPNNPYSQHIEPSIDQIREFYEVTEAPFSENIHFVESYSEMNTLEEVIQSMKGKKIYIDIWATWCGPCKQEFAYKSEIEELLRVHNVVPLYISADRDENASKWEDMIKYYNLEGYHIRANEALQSDILEIVGSLAVPRYLLVDETGKIVNKNASRPSQPEELKKELEML